MVSGGWFLQVGLGSCISALLGGLAGSLHFWGSPRSFSPSWGLGMARGRAEGSKGRGERSSS